MLEIVIVSVLQSKTLQSAAFLTDNFLNFRNEFMDTSFVSQFMDYTNNQKKLKAKEIIKIIKIITVFMQEPQAACQGYFLYTGLIIIGFWGQDSK